jgi:hypothetical protein
MFIRSHVHNPQKYGSYRSERYFDFMIDKGAHLCLVLYLLQVGVNACSRVDGNTGTEEDMYHQIEIQKKVNLFSPWTSGMTENM